MLLNFELSLFSSQFPCSVSSSEFKGQMRDSGLPSETKLYNSVSPLKSSTVQYLKSIDFETLLFVSDFSICLKDNYPYLLKSSRSKFVLLKSLVYFITKNGMKLY